MYLEMKRIVMHELVMDNPELHIKRIRKEFGISDIAQTRDNRISRNLHKAIKRLSEDLYSKDIHFVLEIIQNAEDNHYIVMEPELTFWFLDDLDALLIVNNENGFSPDDVEAICAVGATTKDKRQGYIGEKGIGFKSTFLVSSEPHIFSGGYSFKFQEKPDSIAGFGYIVPNWVSPPPDFVQSLRDKTCIFLPLKVGKRKIVESQLEMISPETILFLKKLKRLNLQFSQNKITRVIKKDECKPLIKLIKNEFEEKYWLMEVDFDVPQDLFEEKRIGITNRIVSVAFPLEKFEDKNETIFAYLPTSLRSGLNFLVNADFILSSNRESVRENLPWNLWLRDCIAPTFIRTFETLLKTRNHKFKPYTFIPLQDEISDPFFYSVSESIQEELKKRKIIWSLNDGKLVEPANARFASMAFRDLTKGKPIPKQLSETPLVHPALEDENIAKRIRVIGVKPLSWHEILACLQDVAWLDAKKSQWYIDLYSFLANQSWATRERLKEVSILLKDGGGRSNGQKEWIYFPSGEALAFAKKHQSVLDHLNIFFLDRKLYNDVKKDPKLFFWLSNTLDVEELNLQNLCLQLTTSLSQNLKDLDPADLIRYTRFLRDNLDEMPESVRSFMRNNLPVLIGSSQVVPAQKWGRETQLVVPELLNPSTGWQNIFSETEDRQHMLILSNSYFQGEQDKKLSKQQWLKFFTVLGATETPWPRKKNWEFSYSLPGDVPIHLQQTIKREYSSKNRYELCDWSAPVWMKKPPKNFGKKAKALITWLRKQENTSDWKKAKYYWYYYGRNVEEYESEFTHLLRNVAWFPTTKGFKRPFEVFLDKPEIREFFGDTLAYSRLEVSDGVAEFLGVRTSATLDQILLLLNKLSSESASEANVRLLRRIYAFISERWKSDLKDLFFEKPLILSAKPKPVWVTSSQAIWPDRQDVFGDAYVYLAPQYETLGDFFVNKIGVAKDVGEREYAQAWINLTKSPTTSPENVESALERIYPILLRIAKETVQPDWWEGFAKEAKIWTQKDKFTKNSNVFIPDDGELRRIFEKENVEFAWRPTKDSFTDYIALFQLLGVRLLTNSVHITAEPVGQQGLTDNNENLLLTEASKIALCYYLRNEMRIQYEQLQNSGLIESILRTREKTVETLKITYSIDGKIAVVNDGIAYWSQEDRVLFISTQQDLDEWETEVSALISRRLVGPQSAKDLENFIARILGSSEKKIAGLIKKKNWIFPEDERELILSILRCEVDFGLEHDVAEKGEESGGEDIEFPENKGAVKERQTKGGTSGGGSGVREPGGPTSGKEVVKKTRSEEWRPRLRSYVEHTQGGKQGTSSGKSEAQARERDEIELAGIEAVVEYEKQFGRYSFVLPHNHEGWDINVFSHVVSDEVGLSGSGAIRRIEVKATKYSWDGWGVGLTSSEFREARKLGDEYYLYVVEHALDPALRGDPIIIRNPANLITEFRFDEEWKKIAVNGSTVEAVEETTIGEQSTKGWILFGDSQ